MTEIVNGDGDDDSYCIKIPKVMNARSKVWYMRS